VTTNRRSAEFQRLLDTHKMLLAKHNAHLAEHEKRAGVEAENKLMRKNLDQIKGQHQAELKKKDDELALLRTKNDEIAKLKAEMKKMKA